MKYTFFFLSFLLSCTTHGTAGPATSKVKFETLFKGEDVIWGFDFLPDGKIIFTEREGKMKVFDPATKQASGVAGLPKIYSAGQAGLLDVRVHPDYAKNKLILFTYSEPQAGGTSTTVLAQAVLNQHKLTDLKKLFMGQKPNDNDIHYGSRIEFDGKGHLFVSMGDRDQRGEAQNLAVHQGKVMRLKLDGSVPADNPFVGKKDAKAEIFSYGHRNPQGLTIHPETGEIWEAEMGPRGGDEINVLSPGKNYGWPVITYGREYYGPKIGSTEKEGMEQPLTYWVPSISPSALAFYTGDKIAEWKGNLFLATLSGEHIRRVEVKDKKVSVQEEVLKDLEYRWRGIRTGPDGYLYLSTDEGRLGRVLKGP